LPLPRSCGIDYVKGGEAGKDGSHAPKGEEIMAEQLATELETYGRNLETLLGTDEGKFVVVHGDHILGAFDSLSDAVTWGYRELGDVPFLVKQVVKVEAPLSFVSNLFGA
jgi:hypothetical protein